MDNFYLFVQIVVPGIGIITTNKAIGADGIGLFCLGFWNYLFGTLAAFFYYTCQWVHDPNDTPFMHIDYQLGLLD